MQRFLLFEVPVREGPDCELPDAEIDTETEIGKSCFAGVEPVMFLEDGCERFEQEVQVAIDDGHVK